MKKCEIKKLDKIWSTIIRQKGKCEICGESNNLNAHHIVGRRNYTLRFDRQNGVCLCPAHHTFSKASAHQDPIWFDQWLREYRSKDYEYLQTQRNLVLKQTYEEVLDSLNE